MDAVSLNAHNKIIEINVANKLLTLAKAQKTANIVDVVPVVLT